MNKEQVNTRPLSDKDRERPTETNKVAKRLQQQRAKELKSDFAGIAEDENGEEWRQELTRDMHGNVLKRAANFELIAQNDPELRCIKYDVFHDKYVINGGIILGRETPYLTDEVLADIAHHIDRVYGMVAVSTNRVMQDIVTVVSKCRRYPVKDDIEAATWDGKPRVDTLLIDYLGADDTPLTRAMTRKWMAAAVARIYEPGIKFDYMLVLSGEECIGKSTFLNILGATYYKGDFCFTNNFQTMARRAYKSWIIEPCNCETARAARASRIFIKSESNHVSTKRSVEKQCVFAAGISNKKEFIRHMGVDRCWWMVEVKENLSYQALCQRLQRERAQIWAEAKVIYEAGEKLYLPNELEEESRKILLSI